VITREAYGAGSGGSGRDGSMDVFDWRDWLSHGKEQWSRGATTPLSSSQSGGTESLESVVIGLFSTPP